MIILYIYKKCNIKTGHFLEKKSYFSLVFLKRKRYNLYVWRQEVFMKGITRRRLFLDYIPMALCAVLIIYFAIVKQQNFLSTLPTVITLFVQLLLVAADRHAFLLGGVNALIYGASYMTQNLYFSAFQAFCVSAPLQLFSFFNWKKKSGKAGHPLCFFGLWRTVFTLLICAFVWGIMVFFAHSLFPSAAIPEIDALIFVLGLAISILSAWGCIESQYINTFNSILALVLWIIMSVNNPANLNYVVISAYNLFRVTQAAIQWTFIYRKEKKAEEPIPDI